MISSEEKYVAVCYIEDEELNGKTIYSAVCINMNMVCQGSTAKKAKSSLIGALEVYIKYCVDLKRSPYRLSPLSMVGEWCDQLKENNNTVFYIIIKPE